MRPGNRVTRAALPAQIGHQLQPQARVACGARLVHPGDGPVDIVHLCFNTFQVRTTHQQMPAPHMRRHSAILVITHLKSREISLAQGLHRLAHVRRPVLNEREKDKGQLGLICTAKTLVQFAAHAPVLQCSRRIAEHQVLNMAIGYPGIRRERRCTVLHGHLHHAQQENGQ